MRTLTIPSPRNFNTDGFCKPLEQLLPKLPLKSLTNFRYSLYGRPTDEGLRYLLHHQEKLTNLQLDLSLAPTLEMLIREEETAIRSLKCLTALCLRFGYGENTSAEKYSELLDMINVTGLQSVILVANGGLGSFGREDLMEQFLKKALPTTLNYLNLSKICLPKSNEQCLHLDKYLSLRHLKLYKCSNAAFTLDSFCQPMLTSFDVVCGSRTSCQEDLAATSSFLRRFRSLDHLEIGNRIVVSEDWVIEDLTMSIANHAASLRSLVIFIHCIPSMSLTGTPLRCEKLCQFVMTEEGTDLVGQCLVSLSHFKVVAILRSIMDFHKESRRIWYGNELSVFRMSIESKCVTNIFGSAKATRLLDLNLYTTNLKPSRTLFSACLDW